MFRILHITIVKLHFPFQNVNILNTFSLFASLEHPEAPRRPSGEPQRPSGDPQGHTGASQEPFVRPFGRVLSSCFCFSSWFVSYCVCFILFLLSHFVFCHIWLFHIVFFSYCFSHIGFCSSCFFHIRCSESLRDPLEILRDTQEPSRSLPSARLKPMRHLNCFSGEHVCQDSSAMMWGQAGGESAEPCWALLREKVAMPC